jgi:hypothetical protein
MRSSSFELMPEGQENVWPVAPGMVTCSFPIFTVALPLLL